QLTTWNGSGWDYPTLASVGGAQGYSGANDWLEYQIPKSALGDPEQIVVELFTTGSGAHAQDTVPSDPNVAYTAPDFGGDTTTLSAFTFFPPVIIDGTHDANWDTPVATDPLGDMTEPNLDLYRLYMAEDADNYYIGFDAYASNWGMAYGIYIDTDQVSGSGGTSDPWGRAVDAVADHLPEYALYVWHPDTDTLEDAQLTTWNGSGWDYPTLASVGGAQGYSGANDWLEYQIPKSALGDPDEIAVELFTTGGGGTHAQDTVPSDPNVAYTTPDFGGDTTTLSEFYIFPQPPLLLQVDSPAEGAFFATPNINVLGSVTPSTGVTVTVDLNATTLYTPTLDASGYFTQAVTLGVGDNTITVEATDGDTVKSVVRHVSFGASHDDNIFWGGLYHDSRDSLYRTPGGAVETGTPVTLRLRAYANDLTAAKVRVWDDRNDAQMVLTMEVAATDGVYDWWEAVVPAAIDSTNYWYRFIAIDGTDTDYYEDDEDRTMGVGQVYDESEDRSWQITVYDPAYETPDWVKNAIIYQIFPDRFRDGDVTNDTPAGTFFYEEGGTIYRSNDTEWNTTLCDPRADTGCTGDYSNNFYGGDLQGIRDKLDYIEDLGVTAIYFNPIFESPSNHKYDTTDFGVIDDNFGVLGDHTASLALFQQLVSEAADRDIHVILDGVFNHTSSDSIYFDRYGRYPEVGACESETSPYRDWYYFTDVEPGTGPCVGSDGTPEAADYESWFGFDSLPKLRADNAEVRDLIWDDGTNSVGPYWMQWADGWRLDVAGDVDPGVTGDPTNDYWEGFRDAVHAVNPDTYIVGEEWGNSTPWLLGQEWDASMNYQFGTAIMGFWRDTTFTDNDHNTGSSAGTIEPLTPSQLEERLHYLEERYPPESFYAMLNLLGSHDTNRALFMMDHNAATGTDDTLLDDPNYDWSDAMTRLKGVVLLQMTLPGAPTIYYGDEVGLVGPTEYTGGKWEDDPYNRVPYPWLDEGGTPFYTHLQTLTGQNELKDHYKLLTAARNEHAALRTGDFKTLLADDDKGVYAYGRQLADNSDAAVIIVNQDDTAQTVTLDVSGYLAAGMTLADVLDNDAPYAVDGAGQLTVADVPAMSGAVLVLSSTTPPPAAVDDLQVIDEADGEVTLGWSAAIDADSYNIYRSLLSGGGYIFLGNTTVLSYTDSGLENATRYYYVVESKDDTTLLVSDYSNEVMGMPHYNIGWANLSGPEEITHTVGISPTEIITGQVWIGGATAAAGATESLMAQLGFGPTTQAPADWTNWVEANFSHDLGNNDVFSATLIPEETGEYHYLYRYSTTSGRDWFYADLSGPISAT
ncbi:MAG: alpha-amylase family glycosyl hydrolase, partial [Anaerolineae bacterium]